MNIGDYECFAIEMGDFLLDGGAMFGIVPKVLWDKKISGDANNRIPLKGRTLLIKGNGRNILVDTGCGSKMNPKQKRIYGVTNTPENPDTLLEHFSLSSSDITDVILTHLHFDHAGGATFIKDGEVKPTYPDARYYVGEIQWNWANSPSPRDRASYFSENFLPLKEKSRLKFVTSDRIQEFVDIKFIQSNGHTPGQILPLLESGGQKLFYCGDLIPTSAHIPVPWHMGYDNEPLTIMKEKQDILAVAAEEKWILFFEHDPVIAAATIKAGSNGYEIEETLVSL